MADTPSVLSGPPPRFSDEDAARIAAEIFGVVGEATNLGSERDQAFLIDDDGAGGVLKISNLSEEHAVLDFEDAAVAHVAGVDPSLPVARPLAARATVDGHYVRLFERLIGHKGGPEIGRDAVREIAAGQARLCVALRSFSHPAAGRRLLWDVHEAAALRPLLEEIADPDRRARAARALDRFEERVLPVWPRLRGQVIHGDFNLDNLLLDENDRLCGILDFGDCCYSALAADLAVSLASFLRGRPTDDVAPTVRVALDGFQSVLPLEELELEALGDLVAARLAAIVVISAWRTRRYPENAEYIGAWDDDSWALLAHLEEIGPETMFAPVSAPTGALARRRAAVAGSLLTPLSYGRPVHAVRAQGVWIHESDGTRLLDAYNNVPVVGHCHPRVAEAIARQTRRLATNARYLYEPLVELSERLLATFPRDAGLDTVILLNSASEANDLAWRIATAVTGNTRAVVTEHAYHGVTEATVALSPEAWPAGFAPPHVVRIPTSLEAELEGVAATFLDGTLMSDGIRPPGPDALRSLVERTHAAGGLYVADEVQAGHGRTGSMWSFTASRAWPDIVTLGKPMGNGFPVAALVTRSDLAERFPYGGRTFSTFGGNPVAASAALAVLEVLEDERLPGRAAQVGERLRTAISELRKPDILEVRGTGLLAGVQLASANRAARAAEALREHGVLVGLTGRHEDALKIRPPLVFADEHTELLVTALDAVL